MMVKRCIGIDIDSSHLRAVQVLHRGEDFYIEKVFSALTRRTTDSPVNIIKSLVKQHAFDRRADVALSMPHDTVFFRNLETDSADAERIQSFDISELEHDFPIQPDEIVAHVCSYHKLPNEKYSVLTAAVSRKLLHERLNILAEAKMRPVLVDTAISAIYSIVAINHPEIMTEQAIIAYVNESHLILSITQNNNILIVRNISNISISGDNAYSIREQIVEALSNEAQITWRKVFDEDIKQNSKLYLINEGSAFDGIRTLVEENLDCQIIEVNPYAKVKNPQNYNDNMGICIAEGLALRALAPEETAGVNFLNADNANLKPVLNIRKEFAVFAALVTAIVVVSLLGLFIRLSGLETKHSEIKNEIRDIFHQTLPEEKNIVNPLAQLEQKLQKLQKDNVLLGPISGIDIRPVEVLHVISKSIPSSVKITIDNMLITAGSVRLTGNSQSFESIYNWQRLLKDTFLFSDVDVRDIRRQASDGSVKFTILATLATQEKKNVAIDK